MNNFNNVKLLKIAKLALKYQTTSANILTDICRKRWLNQKITPFPRVITLYVTNKCNLNCPMCLNANYRNKSQTKGITVNTINKILPELKKYKPLVCITGGEPLLNQELFEIITLLSKNKILTSMTTNGYLLEKHAQRIADSGLEFLSVSLDHYLEEKHDKGRGVKNTYKKLIVGINKLAEIRRNTPSNIKINTVIRKDNFSELSRMYDFIESIGIDEWSLQHFSFTTPNARAGIKKYKGTNFLGDYIVGKNIETDFFLNIDQIKILKGELADVVRKSKYYKTKLSIKPEMNDIFSYYQGKSPSKKSQCNWPFDSINIMESSKVALCLGNEIGNLAKANTIKEIWNSNNARNFQSLILKEKILPMCFRCCGLKYNFQI
ncbi:MAG: hypothetical protein A3D24_01905 [Candidatus Blackburnbacteria bacterium RIFCSPHIGHO2_02_FULL_39_13]|nr:MAG: Radical SAM domain protein [Microgenomates group bacterium GW2011_GWA2_39_19]OGY07361.1 MAG: hypothetical protein A2694_01120 [Candidatus Blackburnbacteria bacterium RIFCSPHIGHO2_01_FULL_40_17]OGY09155.1 MAG: hypothetical protein A3D24_01905 [Candidatus Blackburnbacteria bacterium RIFCSPHIGHO2_02_FULL_39_13]